MVEPRIQYVQTEDSVSIAYWTLGEGQPLVCLPPMAWSHLQLEWQDPPTRAWFEQLAKTRKLVRYDFRGQGLSERSVADISLEACLDDLDALANHLELEKFSLYVMGPNTPLAIAYAARRPERVAHLILFNPATQVVPAGSRGAALLEVAEKDWRTYTEAVGQAFLGWSEGDRARAFAGFIRQSVSQETWLEVAKEFADVDATPLLPQVSAPTLVLARATERQGLDASQVSALASQMQNARVVFLAGTEPVLQLGDTDEGLRAIDEFLSEGDEETAGTPAPSGGLVSILFTDMQSSTALTQQLGDAGAQEVRWAHNEIVRAALAENSGNEIKHTGDGIMASFATTSSALECAIAIQIGVAAHRDAHPDSPLGVYVGLNAGEPIAEDDPDGRVDLFGTSINLASRICDHAEPGQILAADVVRQLAAGKQFLFADLGETELRGFEDPVKLWELRWGAEGSPQETGQG